MNNRKSYFEYLQNLPLGKTEVRAAEYKTDIMRGIVWEYSEKHAARFGEAAGRALVVVSGPTAGAYFVVKNTEMVLALEFPERASRAELRSQVDGLQPGQKMQIENPDAGTVSFLRTYCSKKGGYSVRKTPGAVTVEHAARGKSTRALITEGLSTYQGIIILPASARADYVRPIVSNFNSTSGTSFSVRVAGESILIGSRPDIEKHLKGAAPIKPGDLTADELAAMLTAVMREQGASGQEMRDKLNEYISENDDLF